MLVFVTGATGFVGRALLKHLTATGHEVMALVRPGSEPKLFKSEKVKIQQGDVTDQDALSEGLRGCDAVIHLVGIIREFPRKGITFESMHVAATSNLIAAAASQGIKRYLHMSANGVRADSRSDYHKTKWRAEQAVRDSQLDWTIIRPSLIFGPDSEFVELLAGLIRKLPLVPVIGDGRYRMQPVAVDEVAETFTRALEMPQTVGETYHLGGAKSYSYDEILELTGKALGKQPVRKIHQPVAMVRPVVRLFDDFAAFPLTGDQLTMMLEGNVCDPRPWAEAFGIEPITFADGIGKCFRNGR